MTLLNVRQLSDELRADTLSETTKYRIVLLMLVLQILRHLLEYITQRPSTNHLIYLIISGFISVAGFHSCFSANRRGDNKRFIERFFCLSTALIVWFTAIYLLIFYGGFYLVRIAFGTRLNQFFAHQSWIAISISSLMLVVYFVILNHFTARTAAPTRANSDAPPIAAP